MDDDFAQRLARCVFDNSTEAEIAGRSLAQFTLDQLEEWTQLGWLAP